MSQNTEQKILKQEEKILQTEQQILKEIKSEEKDLRKAERRVTMIAYALLIMAALGISGAAYWKYASSRISIDAAHIAAPIVDLGASVPGTLQEIDVHPGDVVLPDTVVARVGNTTIKTRVGGLVVATQNEIGKRFNPGEAIVSMIDPRELRVIGQLEEDKGLKDVRVGQQATFTVDAFGSRTFYGIVDSVSPTSRESGIVFNISDKRETKSFDIKIRFDINAYPELKNGMSAKMTILQ